MTALNTLSSSIKVSITASAALAAVGSDYQPLARSLSINKTVGPFSTANANAASLGANEIYSAITTVTASGNSTVNLQSLVDFVDQSGITLVRVKGFIIRLLSQADDSTTGTQASSVTINGAGTNLAVLPGITNLTLSNGDVFAWATPSATGITVSSTTENIYIANNDASHSAAVQITVVGGTT